MNYTILDEGTLREVITSGEQAGGRRFDVVMIGPYEAPQFGRDGLIRELTPMASSDTAYALEDIIPSVRNALSYQGRLYAAPFYGESSFLMYRKDVLADAGIEMPAHPTWRQVAEIARRIDTPERAGICLRGKPGWGDLGGSFGTVLNTFGGTWWSAKPDGSVDKAMVDQPEFREALQFYVDLVRDAGESHPDRASYNQCLEQYLSGKVSMWYDATVAAGLLEADNSDVKGKNGYAPAPVELHSGLRMALVVGARHSDDVEQGGPGLEVYLVGGRTAVHQGGWASDRRRLGCHPSGHAPLDLRDPRVPEGRPRVRLLDAGRHRVGSGRRPGHHEAAGPAGSRRLCRHSGVSDVGNQCTEQFAAVIAGRSSVDAALANCQEIASRVGR